MNEQTGLNRLRPVFTGFMVMSLISVAPVLNFINLFFCAGIILGGIAGVAALNKQLVQLKRPLFFKDAVLTGVLSGVLSSVLVSGFNIITMLYSDLNPINESIKLLEGYIKNIPPEAANQLSSLAEEFNKYGYSPTLAVFTFISNLIIYPLFGAAGALIAASFINNRNRKNAGV